MRLQSYASLRIGGSALLMVFFSFFSAFFPLHSLCMSIVYAEVLLCPQLGLRYLSRPMLNRSRRSCEEYGSQSYDRRRAPLLPQRTASVLLYLHSWPMTVFRGNFASGPHGTGTLSENGTRVGYGRSCDWFMSYSAVMGIPQPRLRSYQLALFLGTGHVLPWRDFRDT